MADESTRASAAEALRRINQAWRSGRLDDLAPMLHPDIVMVLPGFSGEGQGRETLLAGFRDFCDHATVHEFIERDTRVTVVDDVAVATFRFTMLYERDGQRSRTTGRDMWVLRKQHEEWVAVWRTMLDIEESPA